MRKINYQGRPFFILRSCIMTLLVGFILLGLMLVVAPGRLQRAGDAFAPRPDRISIATASESGHYYRIAGLIRDEMHKERGQTVDVLRTEGSIDNIGRILNGTADFALIQGGLDHGLIADLTAVAQVSRQYVHLLVPADSDMYLFRDLEGKRLCLGPAQSGNDSLGRLVCDFFWPEGGPSLVNGPVMDLEAAFAEKRIDAAFLVYDVHAPIVERLLYTGGFRLLALPEAEAVAAAVPGTYPATIPGGTYGPRRTLPPADQPVRTLQVKTLLVTRGTTSRFAVEGMLQVLYAPSFLKRAHLSLTEAEGRDVFEVPLHPAAERFYRRNDPITSDMFEIGSFFIAVILVCASLLGYVSKRAKERHLDQLRERIVPYFETLLRTSKALALVDNVPDLEALLHKMMATQREAETAWLKGELDTEHMENLYAIYGIHCSNAFQKLQQLLHIRRLSLLEGASQAPEAEAADQASL